MAIKNEAWLNKPRIVAGYTLDSYTHNTNPEMKEKCVLKVIKNKCL
jgi:hypothetical protein